MARTKPKTRQGRSRTGRKKDLQFQTQQEEVEGMSLDDGILDEAFRLLQGGKGTWYLKMCLDDQHEGSRRYLTLDPDKDRKSCEACVERDKPYNSPQPPRGAA